MNELKKNKISPTASRIRKSGSRPRPWGRGILKLYTRSSRTRGWKRSFRPSRRFSGADFEAGGAGDVRRGPLFGDVAGKKAPKAKLYKYL